MSQGKGDKSRYNLERGAKLARRVKMRALRAESQAKASATPKKAAASTK